MPKKQPKRKQKRKDQQPRKQHIRTDAVFFIGINDMTSYIKKWHPTAPPGGHEPSVIRHKLT